MQFETSKDSVKSDKMWKIYTGMDVILRVGSDVFCYENSNWFRIMGSTLDGEHRQYAIMPFNAKFEADKIESGSHFYSR